MQRSQPQVLQDNVRGYPVQLRKGYPVGSQLDVRKRCEKGNGGGSKWIKEFEKYNMTKHDVANKASVFKRHKDRLENEVRPLRKVLGAKRAAQTLARKDSNLHENDPTRYQTLVQARTEVRAARSGIAPKLKELHHA
ncbi:hypothetical protein BGZ67_000318 [Mortierella alpina]|nr:hypothetical protein BGZ67_000318 [Mortierella alpina]